MRQALRKLESVFAGIVKASRVLPIQLDITNLCNLRCTHCYHPHHRNEGALTLEGWINILDQYERLCQKWGYQRELILCGGEPALSPHLVPILQYALSLGSPYRLAILSNGTLVNRYPHQLISKFSHRTFQVSLDGPTALEHDVVRGKGSFERSLEGVERLKQKGHSVELLAILSKRSSNHISEFFHLAKRLGIDSLGFTRLISTGTGQQLVESRLDRPLWPQELRAAYIKILRASLETGVTTNTSSPLMNLLHPSLGSRRRHGEALIIDYKGQMLASSRSAIVLGSVPREGLESLHFTHPLKRRLRKGNISPCADCSHFDYCGGDRNSAYAEHGDYFGPDPGCWLTSKTEEEKK